jgi:hypothetical protein
MSRVVFSFSFFTFIYLFIFILLKIFYVKNLAYFSKIFEFFFVKKNTFDHEFSNFLSKICWRKKNIFVIILFMSI